ncbi:cobalt transporter [Pseudodesulfovibrio sp. S3]|nr:cobalt transporter [Pseudodesulfovibrio sp. S3]
MRGIAAYVGSLDPRLKMAVALVLGPCLWKVHVAAAAASAFLLLLLAWPLSSTRPVGGKMVRSMLVFVFFWVGFKVVLDALAGVPVEHVANDAVQLSVRLIALLLLGLVLALSTSARALGLAVAWAMRPFVGSERAWRIALALALMVHFLPTCLETMSQVREVVGRRCPDVGFFSRMRMIPQAVIRCLGQKTWNQTLAVASRGLENAAAWESDFTWHGRDWVWAGISVVTISFMLFL